MHRLVSSTLPMSCSLTVTRRVFLVVQDMFILPKYLNLPPNLCGVPVAQSVVFSIVFYQSLYDLVSLFVQPLQCLAFDLRILISSEYVWIVDIIVCSYIYVVFFVFFVFVIFHVANITWVPVLSILDYPMEVYSIQVCLA